MGDLPQHKELILAITHSKLQQLAALHLWGLWQLLCITTCVMYDHYEQLTAPPGKCRALHGFPLASAGHCTASKQCGRQDAELLLSTVC